jgi:hypothetical protein
MLLALMVLRIALQKDSMSAAGAQGPGRSHQAL